MRWLSSVVCFGYPLMLHCFYWWWHFQDMWKFELFLMVHGQQSLQHVIELAALFWFYFYLCLIQLVLYNWKYLQFSSVGVRSWMESSRYRQQTHSLLIYLYMWLFIIFLYAWWRLVSLLPTPLPKGMHSNGDLMHLCLTLIVTLNQLFHLLTSITLQVKLSQ